MRWNLKDVDTKGASSETAAQDGLPAGIASSQAMAKTDLKHIRPHESKIKKVAEETDINSAIMAAIISRETRGGTALRSDGYGQYDPNGYGLMQVDKRWHTPECGPESTTHIRQGTKILKGFIKDVKKRRPSWSAEQVLKGGIAAYNGGVDGVLSVSYDRMDDRTAGKDYSSDVVATAKYYLRKGFD